MKLKLFNRKKKNIKEGDKKKKLKVDNEIKKCKKCEKEDCIERLDYCSKCTNEIFGLLFIVIIAIVIILVIVIGILLFFNILTMLSGVSLLLIFQKNEILIFIGFFIFCTSAAILVFGCACLCKIFQ